LNKKKKNLVALKKNFFAKRLVSYKNCDINLKIVNENIYCNELIQPSKRCVNFHFFWFRNRLSHGVQNFFCVLKKKKLIKKI